MAGQIALKEFLGEIGKSQCQAPTARHLERGRRRTRQDQISAGPEGPVKLRSKSSAPNEENLFLLPDRF
jgi:hypothetical protein